MIALRDVDRTLLDAVMPSYDKNEVHYLVIDAAPDVVYRAAREVTAGEIRLLRPLMFVRMLPARIRGTRVTWDASMPAIELFVASGFTLLGERPGREIVAGAIGKYWSITRNQPVVMRDAAAFMAFSEPGYAKAAMSLLVVPDGERTRIVTETRVASTSLNARKAFARYWIAIRWGSGAIRRSWLAAIKRRAMSASAVTPRDAT